MERKRLFWIALVLALVRLWLAYGINPELKLNNDEHLNWQTAQNHVEGHGYSLVDRYTHEYKATAFHNSFTVLLYEAMIVRSVPPAAWVAFVLLLSAVLYVLSAFAFRSLALRFVPARSAFGAAVLYLLYPSYFYYLGALFMHENIVLPLLVIAVERALRCLEQRDTWKDRVVIALAVIVSVVLRSQTLVIYFLLWITTVFLVHGRRRYAFIVQGVLLAGVVLLIHVPVLRKNKAQFGHAMLSTQAGYEFLQGHNPLARGSWMGFWDYKGNPLYIYVHREIPGVDTLDEYEEGQARAALALRWMKQEPLNELVLDVRKVAIWSMPMNYEKLPYFRWFNGMNFLVHFFFIVSVCVMIVRWRALPFEKVFLAPIVGSLLLTVVFFMGARWRYYAEPFMLLFAMKGMLLLRDALLKRAKADR